MKRICPVVSVIVPVFNVAPYLRKCLDSVAGQTLADIEIICVDDGSTDGSLSILEDYAAKDARFKVLTQKNRGAGEARNSGMGRAKGEFLFFFDGDDFAKPKMLERMVDFAQSHNADVVVSEFYHYDDTLHAVYDKHRLPSDLVEREVVSGRDIADRVFRIFKWSPWNKLFRRTFVENNGIRWQSVFRCNDIAFVNEAVSLADSIGLIGEAFYYYREHSGMNLCSKRDATPLAQYEAWCELRKRLQEKREFCLFADDFKRVVYIGAINNLNSIESPEALAKFFADLKKKIIPDMELSRYVFTEASKTSVYEALARDIEESDTPLPFLLRYRTLFKANMRKKLSRRLLVEKRLRLEIRELKLNVAQRCAKKLKGVAFRTRRMVSRWLCFERRI